MTRKSRGRRLLRRGSLIVVFLGVLGPGLITASADNDAQGVTTYAQVGAQQGYRLLWLLLIVTFSLAVTQEIGARLGIATGKGLAALIRERFGLRAASWAMLLLLIANLGTTAAEFAGLAAALELLHVSKFVSVPVGAVLVFVLISRGTYRRVERVFLVLSVIYIVYVVSGLLAHPAWPTALRNTVMPSFTPTTAFMLAAVGLVGTTVTPWGQFFIQAYVVDKGLSVGKLNYERADVFIGVLITDFVAFFIIVATAATLYTHGLRNITSASQAALALRPLAGRFAAILFGLGLLNASLLSACVLPLSTAYPICEALGFEMGVSRPLREAPIFYGIFAFCIVFGAVVVLLPGASLIAILFFSAVLNGVLLAPLLIYLYIIVNDRAIMGEHANGRFANVLTLATIVLLIGLTVVLLAATLHLL